MAAMAAPMLLTMIIGGAMAYTQYTQASRANEAAVEAANQRNTNLKMKYAQEGAVESTKNERQQKKMSQESYLKTEQIAASIASSSVAVGSGTARTMQASVSDSYALAGLQLGQASGQAQRMGYLGLTMGMDQTQQALQDNWQNPMQQAFSGLMQGAGMYGGISDMGGEGWNMGFGDMNIGSWFSGDGAPSFVGSAPSGWTSSLPDWVSDIPSGIPSGGW